MRNFNILGYSFSSYWSMLVIGAITVIVISILRAKRYKISYVKALIMAFFVVVLGCLGAKMLYMIQNPASSFSWRGGMSLYGSVFLIPVGFVIISLMLRVRYAKCMDFIAVYGPLFFAVMRVGCYLNGCCGGIIIDFFGDYLVPPVQLIECALDVAIMAFLLWRERNIKTFGFQYPIFMVSYSGIRFFIEFIRNTQKIYCFLSEGQWISIFTFVMGLCILLFLFKEEKNYEKYKINN